MSKEKEVVTTLLDVTGVVLLALGIAAALAPLIGYAALAPAGLVLLAASRMSLWIENPRRAPAWWRRLFRGER